MKIKIVPLSWFGIIIVVGMIGSAFALSHLLIRLEKESKLQVKGYAESNIISDRGRFDVVLTVSDKVLKTAYSTLNQQTDMVLAKIKTAGFKPEEITVGGMRTLKVVKKNANGKDTNELDFYQLSQPITIASDNVKLISSKYKTFNDLLLLGLEITVNSPEYFISNLDKCKMDLLAQATQNGYDRARLIAQSSGGRIGGLKSARQGVFQITAPDSGDISDYGVYDLSSITKNAKIVVTLTYQLK
ncbi:MAG: SIMPL domain-containing protein [Victivallales bacterium]|nr:SIMPL domain-containing protein [Victivallales bacterium]